MVAASKGARWLVEGHEDFDGNIETDEVEVFPGVGLWGRPKSSHRVEAIALKVGGESGHAVIVATRNQDGVRLLGAIEEDETVVFTSTTMVKIAADGQVLIGRIGGEFKAVATEDHRHSVSGLTAGGDPVTGTMGKSNDNTSKLRAE